MIKKIIGFNGSPNKGWNTDLLVQRCLDGAKSKGAQIKLYEISDFHNIKSCNGCKICRQNDEKCKRKCVIQDDLSPILEEIKKADAIVIGSPIYYGLMSSTIHPVLERMCSTNYIPHKLQDSENKKHIKTGMIITVNCNEKLCKQMYQEFLDHCKFVMSAVFGNCDLLPVYNTIQIEDYSKDDVLDLDQKFEDRRHLYPKELQDAYEMGKKLVS